jgi:hypothetical protein
VDPREIGDLLTGAGVIGILGFALVAFSRGWLVSERNFNKVVELKDAEIARLREELDRERSETHQWRERFLQASKAHRAHPPEAE